MVSALVELTSDSADYYVDVVIIVVVKKLRSGEIESCWRIDLQGVQVNPVICCIRNMVVMLI